MLLADGRLHSGEWLAQELAVSRAAVWKGIERLRRLGIDIAAVPRRGYRLPCAVELLDERLIRAALAPERGRRLQRLQLLFEVDSTNDRLLAAKPPTVGCAQVVMSELQHAGRGRRGRQWVTPFGSSIALSLGWSFADASWASPASMRFAWQSPTCVSAISPILLSSMARTRRAAMASRRSSRSN